MSGSKRGGARKGAGRPTGRQNTATRSQGASLGELARKHTADALKVLVEVAKKSESDSARVAAANAILDRGYGKARQAVEHSGTIGTYDLTRVTDEQLDHLESILGPLALAGGDTGGEGQTTD